MGQTPYSTQAPVSYKHLTNAGTVVVKAAPGVLYGVNINGVAAASTGTIYDASGTAAVAGSLVVGIMSIGTTDLAPNYVTIGPPATGLELNNGLVIITTGSLDATIAFK